MGKLVVYGSIFRKEYIEGRLKEFQDYRFNVLKRSIKNIIRGG